jgi:hypothetical protein
MAFQPHNTRAARLTPEDVANIRERYADGATTQGALARHYRVSVNTIGRIVRGESWNAYSGPRSEGRYALDPASPNPPQEEINSSLDALNKLLGDSTP